MPHVVFEGSSKGECSLVRYVSAPRQSPPGREGARWEFDPGRPLPPDRLVPYRKAFGQSRGVCGIGEVSLLAIVEALYGYEVA